jgi:hypothetical protein
MNTQPEPPGPGCAYDRLAVGLMLKLDWHPVHFGMQRRQLLNRKRRAEVAA